jgi:uncharacterized repeat protein (TIGR01451 family)
MKRVLHFVVALAVMLSLLIIPASAADGAVTINLIANKDSVKKAGETVTYTITVSNPTGKGIAGMSFEVKLPSGLQYVSHEIKCTGDGLFLSESELKQSAAYKALGSNTSGLSLPLVQYNNGAVLFDGTATASTSGITKTSWTVMTLTCKATGAVSDPKLSLSSVSVYSTDTSGNATSLTVNTNNAIYGDVNGDGKVKTNDLTRLKKYLAGVSVDIDQVGADANGDGKVKTNDLTRLKKYLAGSAQLG